jgi:hypothetical protein
MPRYNWNIVESGECDCLFIIINRLLPWCGQPCSAVQDGESSDVCLGDKTKVIY